MDPAINQAIDNANQANNVTMWILFTVFVIAPLAFALICIPVAIATQRRLKCPNCGNWRKNKSSGIRTTKTVDGNKATLTTQRVIICKKCKNEFSV